MKKFVNINFTNKTNNQGILIIVNRLEVLYKSKFLEINPDQEKLRRNKHAKKERSSRKI